ncbi:MAG: hypothetical protein AAB569_01490 [Patescibacteria group bacterium]
MKKITEAKKKVKELFFKCGCSCNCGQQLLVNVFDKDSIEINTRIDGRRKWTGVILNKKEVKRLRDFLN